jgi:hypothetical protein
MSSTDVYVSPTRVPAGIALLLALVGLGTALAGVPWVGLGTTAASIVLAVVCLVRGLARYLAGVAAVVAVVAALAVILPRLLAG